MRRGVEKVAVGVGIYLLANELFDVVTKAIPNLPRSARIPMGFGAIVGYTTMRVVGTVIIAYGTVDIAEAVSNNYENIRHKVVSKKKKVERSFKKKMGKVVDFKRS